MLDLDTYWLKPMQIHNTTLVFHIAERRGSGGGRMRELLECPVCMEEMKPPKKIFQVDRE
jgi:hypothetical protein